MVDVAPPFVPAVDTAAESARPSRAGIIGFCRRQPLGTIGLALLLAIAVARPSLQVTLHTTLALTIIAPLPRTRRAGRPVWARISLAATCSPASCSARAPP